MDAGTEPRPSSACLTSLMVACQQGLEFDVRTILSRKPAAVLQRDRSGKTALHYCAENNNLSCAEQILAAAPGLVNVQDDEGYSPLHLAVISGNRGLVRFLIRRGADVTGVDSEKHSCVHWATVCGELECLDILIDAGADPSTPDIHGAFPIHYAAQMCGPNSEMGNNVKLGLAVLRKLIAHGVYVNCQDQDGRQPLLWAASTGSSDAILALIKAGAKVCAEDKDGLTALHCAASRGHLDCLETLITLCGAEVDTVDSNGCSALFYAVTLGHADCTHLLLKFGSQANRQDKRGRTPAHCGASKGQLETLKILAHHGANLWLRNVRGDMPLHEAVQSGRKDLVQWLLEQEQGSVNVSNSHGRTPMHIAAITNNVEMCKVLMDHGAFVNPIMRNSKGQLMTPLDAALHRGNRGCAKYLQLHGAYPASKLVERNEYNRSLMGNSDGYQGSLESISERRELRESAAQTEDHHILRDADVQVHLERRPEETGNEHIIRELRQELAERGRMDNSRGNNAGKPIIAKVYVHTKRSRDRRTSRRSDDRNDCQDSMRTGGREERDGDDRGRRLQESPCINKSCIPRRVNVSYGAAVDRTTCDKEKKVVSIREPVVVYNETEETRMSPTKREIINEQFQQDLGIVDNEVVEERQVCCGCPVPNKSTSPRISKDCDCNCHQDVSSPHSDVKETVLSPKDKAKEMTSDMDNHSPLSSIRSIESTVKDSGFSDDVDRDNADASSEGEDRQSPEYRKKRKPVVRYLVSSGAADTFRFVEEEEEEEESRSRRSISMPTLQEKPQKPEVGHRLLTRPTVSKEVQKSLRKYQMERRLFHELQELKRQQICGGHVNEQTTVKKLIERFRRHVLSPGMKDYQGPLTFRAFEKYLYEQLRRLSTSGKIPRPKKAIEDIPPRSYVAAVESPANPALCVCRTHKCHHATEAYSGRTVHSQKNASVGKVALPEIPAPPTSVGQRPFPNGIQSKIPVSRSQSWDRMETKKYPAPVYQPKLNGIISNSLPALSFPFPKKVPASLLAAVAQRLGENVHPDDTVIIEMSSPDIPTKLRHAFSVREIQEAVKQCEARGGKVRPFPLETVLDPDDEGPVTFEIRHGRERNVFRLPADKLKDNKKWFLHYCLWPVGRYVLSFGENVPLPSPEDLETRSEMIQLSPRTMLLLPDFNI